MRIRGGTIFVAIFSVPGLAVSGCDRTFDPDAAQRNSTAETVIEAAMAGNKQRLLDVALTDLQEQETAADALIAQASQLKASSYDVHYEEHHGAPDNYIVSASDGHGGTLSFELDWHEAKWQLALGTAGPPKSPAASP